MYRTKQTGYKRGLRRWCDIRTNSSNNTVYADAEGNMLYFQLEILFPKRDRLSFESIYSACWRRSDS